jgi:hypothetical protein
VPDFTSKAGDWPKYGDAKPARLPRTRNICQLFTSHLWENE